MLRTKKRNKQTLLVDFRQRNHSMAAMARDAADQNFDYMFKLLIIGNSSVGKTSFLFRYADDSFTSAFVSTVGIDFKVKTVFRGDKRVKLQVCTFNLSNSRQDALHSLKCSRYFDHSCQYLFSPSSSPLLDMGYSGPREVQDNHNSLLPRCHGIYFNVRRHK